MEKPEIDDTLLFSRLEDAQNAARHHQTRFLGFLDKRQQVILIKRLDSRETRGISACFWGGYPDAERQILGVFPANRPSDGTQFPIGAIHAVWKGKSLSHRDFLGALLSLGIRREKIGDILVRAEDAIFLLENEISLFVFSNLRRVSNMPVSCEIFTDKEIVREDHFEEITGTIASARLDCMVSALTGSSRAQAEKQIISGLVSVNWIPVTDGSIQLSPETVLSIRGCGRFRLDSVGPQTKKGRLRFLARKSL